MLFLDGRATFHYLCASKRENGIIILTIIKFAMRLRKLFVAALTLFSTTAMVAQEMQMPPIPVDPAVRIGKLDNGLTYYIRHNEYPEHVANFYIAQRAGSINEA
jgi:hypothetical protein